MIDLDRAYAAFPLWIELSGLPAQLAEKTKGPLAWWVFRKIVELDLEQNRVRPGMVEVALSALAERVALPADKVEKQIKPLRKAALLRAFLPDTPEEPALFQVITPLTTPRTPDEVRATYPDLFLETPWPPRYAVEVKEPVEGEELSADAKVKRLVELYFNVFSMKMNSIILDQLQIISDRYDMALIERVFEKAKKREAATLSWILTEIRREEAFKAKAAQESPGSAG